MILPGQKNSGDPSLALTVYAYLLKYRGKWLCGMDDAERMSIALYVRTEEYASCVPGHVADSTAVSRSVITRSLSMTYNIIIIAPITAYHTASVLLVAPISKHFRTGPATSAASEGRPTFCCRTENVYRPINK